MSDHPKQIGRYQISRVLGSGGMATVYHAQMETRSGLTKQVALKVLHPHLVNRDDFLNMFLDEARITAQLVHGNIVSVFDSGKVDGVNYIAMEYVDGMDLSSLNKLWKAQHKRALPLDCLVYLTTQILCGLQYAHTKAEAKGRSLGIVHRDLSPQNIMLSRSGEVKIADFGIAMARNRITVTEVGVLKGKRRYMSPEQLVGRPVDARSDLYSLALMTLELLTGQPAFTSRNGLAEFVPSPKVKRLLGRGVLRFLRQALASEADRRFSCADEFRDAFREAVKKQDCRFNAMDLKEMVDTLDLARERGEITADLITAESVDSIAHTSDRPLNDPELGGPAERPAPAEAKAQPVASRKRKPRGSRGLEKPPGTPQPAIISRSGTIRGARWLATGLFLVLLVALTSVILLHHPAPTVISQPQGMIKITSDWPIDVYVGKRSLGTTPIERSLPFGEYAIKLVDPATGWRQVITRHVNPGKVTSIHLSAR